MRDIKIKYYYKNSTGEIISKVFDLDVDVSMAIGSIYLTIPYEMRDYEIIGRVQYTGLKDKSGVEIYEGDVVELENNFIAEVEISPLNGVEFKSRNRNYRDEFASEYGNYIGNFPCEVIGNIYENPELLGE